MKKFGWLLLTLCLCVTCGTVSIACGGGQKIEVTFDETEITLQSGETKEIGFTVEPAGAEVMYGVSTGAKHDAQTEDVLTVSLGAGTVRITARSAGTWTVYVGSPSERNMRAECTVTVAPPQGYTVYRGTDVKFVYPSEWQSYDAAGTVAAFKNETTGDNINLTSEPKNAAYFSATTAQFRKIFEDAWKAMGADISIVSFVSDKYDSDSAVYVSCEYSVAGVGKFFQQQRIRHSDDKTYILTLTVARERLGDVVGAEEIALRNTMEKEFKTWEM